MNYRNLNCPRRSRGIILLLVLVLLGILMIIVATLVSSSNVNFRIAGNQQYRLESRVAAQNAIESYISNSANFSLPLPTASSSIGIDLDGNGVNEYTAVVPPATCVRSQPIKNSELDISNADDQPCYGSGSMQNSGVLSSSSGGSGNSWCSKMMWDVRSTVSDAATSANITLHQGIYLRALLGTPCPN